MTKLYLFNPQSDLSLACNALNYSPPPRARKIADNLSSLPIFYASDGSIVLVANDKHRFFADELCRQLGIRVNVVTTLKGVDIDSSSPWGWSLATVADLARIGVSKAVLPSSENIERLRYLSSKERSIEVIEMLKYNGIDTPDIPPRFVDNIADVIEFILTYPLTVIKSPWSNSGKGVVWGVGRREQSIEQVCSGFIKRQGGVLCEKFHNKVIDFAMEFNSTNKGVVFAGYSLFKTTKGVYEGNILTSDANIEELLCRYVSAGGINSIKTELPKILTNLIDGDYIGYLGVDMMIYKEGDRHRINPCVEINLRMNMGMTANIFYNRFVSKDSWGEFKIIYNTDTLAIEQECRDSSERYPLKVVDGLIVSGYMPLTPVFDDTNYLIEVLINEGSFDIDN